MLRPAKKSGLELAEGILREFKSSSYPDEQRQRGIYCNRTLNLRSISCIGYDMDYTLVQYNVIAWEGKAYTYGKENLRNAGLPVEDLKFDPDLVIRGLIIDLERGNLVKADRFGYIKRAMHGTRMMGWAELSATYGRELVDLRDESRWRFLNTLFSVSEACLYMQMVDKFDQMVDKFDQGAFPNSFGGRGYRGVYKLVAKALFRAHVEGRLKAEIMQEPADFVIPDPEIPLTLMDQKLAGKKEGGAREVTGMLPWVLLITNSDLEYTQAMMAYAFDQYLPDEVTWRDLFEMVIVSSRKPEFFSGDQTLYEVVTEDGLMRPCHKPKRGGLYCGGSARNVENALGLKGDETLYVGDHIYTDVSQSKLNLRWRTCLILRELEEEVDALSKVGRALCHTAPTASGWRGERGDPADAGMSKRCQRRTPRLGRNVLRACCAPAAMWLVRAAGNRAGAQRLVAAFAQLQACRMSDRCGREAEHRVNLRSLMLEKEIMGDAFNQLRLGLQRQSDNQSPPVSMSSTDVESTLARLLLEMERLDKIIIPKLEEDGRHFNKHWGYLSRSGMNDKSHLTKQINKYADIYTSRVSNFMRYTPFMYFRSPSQTLAHDREAVLPGMSPGNELNILKSLGRGRANNEVGGNGSQDAHNN
ncbi:hypothetical protein CYMTET_13969 [Cymbomonas tetramitiformis]|uniref:5'-nucleotidase n=1 Tax=Cymbomonas tetramitiformis TaxID=36881 RepID=A0AAE0LAH4_9CHLO|nr:hypothetical protein CYMTET_13969 [Cymbomonas tetramitiformis]